MPATYTQLYNAAVIKHFLSLIDSISHKLTELSNAGVSSDRFLSKVVEVQVALSEAKDSPNPDPTEIFTLLKDILNFCFEIRRPIRGSYVLASEIKDDDGVIDRTLSELRRWVESHLSTTAVKNAAFFDLCCKQNIVEHFSMRLKQYEKYKNRYLKQIQVELISLPLIKVNAEIKRIKSQAKQRPLSIVTVREIDAPIEDKASFLDAVHKLPGGSDFLNPPTGAAVKIEHAIFERNQVLLKCIDFILKRTETDFYDDEKCAQAWIRIQRTVKGHPDICHAQMIRQQLKKSFVSTSTVTQSIFSKFRLAMTAGEGHQTGLTLNEADFKNLLDQYYNANDLISQTEKALSQIATAEEKLGRLMLCTRDKTPLPRYLKKYSSYKILDTYVTKLKKYRKLQNVVPIYNLHVEKINDLKLRCSKAESYLSRVQESMAGCNPIDFDKDFKGVLFWRPVDMALVPKSLKEAFLTNYTRLYCLSADIYNQGIHSYNVLLDQIKLYSGHKTEITRIIAALIKLKQSPDENDYLDKLKQYDDTIKNACSSVVCNKVYIFDSVKSLYAQRQKIAKKLNRATELAKSLLQQSYNTYFDKHIRPEIQQKIEFLLAQREKIGQALAPDFSQKDHTSAVVGEVLTQSDKFFQAFLKKYQELLQLPHTNDSEISSIIAALKVIDQQVYNTANAKLETVTSIDPNLIKTTAIEAVVEVLRSIVRFFFRIFNSDPVVSQKQQATSIMQGTYNCRLFVKPRLTEQPAFDVDSPHLISVRA